MKTGSLSRESTEKTQFIIVNLQVSKIAINKYTLVKMQHLLQYLTLRTWPRAGQLELNYYLKR